MEKFCKRCSQNKQLSDFGVNKLNKDGLWLYCKDCAKDIARAYREKNIDLIRHKKALNINKSREWNKLYARRNKEKMKAYYHENKKELRLKQKIYREKNKEKIKLIGKNYQINNRDKLRKYGSNYVCKRRKSDCLFKLKMNIRSRIMCMFKKNKWTKNTKSEKILGCTFEFAKKWIEKQFKKGMNWENHGEWHIDHKIPLAYAKNEQELKELCHYTNLQPLWGLENLKKRDNILPIQVSLSI